MIFYLHLDLSLYKPGIATSFICAIGNLLHIYFHIHLIVQCLSCFFELRDNFNYYKYRK